MCMCCEDAAKPTVVSEVLESYISWLVPGYGEPTYANLKDNFFLYLGTDAAQQQEGQAQQVGPGHLHYHLLDAKILSSPLPT